MDENDILNFLISLSKEMGNISMNYFKNLKEKDVQNKTLGIDDPVTIADLEISKHVIKRIKEKFKDKVSILCEETELDIDINKPMFIIDELDGTRSFRDGKNNFCHLLCYYDKEPLIAVIYVPVENNLYYAIKGKGAYKNNKRIFCSKNKFDKNNKGIFSLTSNEKHYNKFKEIIDKFKNLKNFIPYTNSNIKGSFGYQAVNLSESEIDFFYGTRPRVWDIAASFLIVEEAGDKCYILRNEEDLINLKKWIFEEHYKLEQVPVLFTNSYVDEGLFDFLRKPSNFYYH
jgi:fructose-1,6-bisphosphatase/inositol monophosphatase family enzyme